LGEQFDAAPTPFEVERVRRDLGALWTAWQEAGQPSDVESFAEGLDAGAAGLHKRLRRVIAAIDLLELGPVEIARARNRMLRLAFPEKIDPAAVERAWFAQRRVARAGR
ncbi:MAG: hypothetical protein AAGA55_08955, partial [Planctomycetota bacterium]